MTDPLTRLTSAGVSVWLAGLGRSHLGDGALERLRATGRVSGALLDATVLADAIRSDGGYDRDATVLADAIRSDGGYDREVAELALTGVGADDALRSLTACDARWACDVMGSAFEASQGADGHVAVAIDPRLAHNAARLADDVGALRGLVDRPNLIAVIPATEPGLRAAVACLAEGISVGLDLVFSPDRFARVQEAFLTGLEQALRRGLGIGRIAAVALFSPEAVDSVFDAELDRRGIRSHRLRGRAGIAMARLAYAEGERLSVSPRWRSLEQEGARPLRLMWTSATARQPMGEDTRYVEALVAPGTVCAVDTRTLKAVEDHGLIRTDVMRGSAPAAHDTLDDLALRGLELGAVIEALERGSLAGQVAERARLTDHLAAVMNGEIVRSRWGAPAAQLPGGGESFV
ncbi:transaldolase family protein [Streptacidiphilus anmyonensis]|uniref:transaldolase family protein n=1 Tax=Streptacidiphilus anmyonensis TaxID=405782 RepID=UPI0005A7635D|nr:transaldolase family protein [Streptacidiphilus anmyonensis]